MICLNAQGCEELAESGLARINTVLETMPRPATANALLLAEAIEKKVDQVCCLPFDLLMEVKA